MKINLTDKISDNWLILFALLRQALQSEGKEQSKEIQQLTPYQWKSVVEKAKKHSILPLLYDQLQKEQSLPPTLFEYVQNMSRRTVQQSYKMLYQTNHVVKLLERGSVSVVVLKGVATADLYPYPELRKSGDIDLLLPNGDEVSKACSLMEAQGYQLKGKQHANHHVVYESKQGIAIELHSMLAEPFDNSAVNRYLQKLTLEYNTYKEVRNILGSNLPVPQTAYHAYYLLVHMLQHFMGSGFGLKLLCDWVVLWNRVTKKEDQDQFMRLVEESDLRSFAECITAVCTSYLGLDETKVHFLKIGAIAKSDVENMLLEILEAEEFGKSDSNRMVILRGTAPMDYLRELHYQMQLNYPNYGNYIILWPVLWSCTLGKFLYNNRKVRKTSLYLIIKKAHFRSKKKWYIKYLK